MCTTISQTTERRTALLFFIVIGLALLAGTLGPATGSPPDESGLCVICGQVGGADFVANILAFVPLGMAAAWVFRSTRRAALFAVAFTLTIELLQWRLVPGRDASLGDLAANALGGASGALLAAHWRRVLLPDRARALIVAWSALGIATVGATYWMLMPSPVIYRYWAYWAPLQRGHQPFRGAIRRIALFGKPIPHQAKVEPSEMPSAYRSGEVDLALQMDPPFPVETPAEIFRLANPLSQRANVAVVDGDVMFQPPLNAARWRFWSPSVRFVSALEPVGTTLMHFQSRRGVVTLEVRQQGRPPAVRRATLGPADSWKFLTRESAVPRPMAPLLSLSWFIVVFAPLGLGASATGQFRAGILGATAVAVSGFVIAPLLTGLPYVPTVHWLGALLAVLLGWACGRMLGTGRPSTRA